MIQPYFDDADIIYFKANKEESKLQRLQNRILKCCMQLDKRTMSKTLPGISKVPLLENRRITHLKNFMHLSSKSLLKENAGNDENTRITRTKSAPHFEIPRPLNETLKRSVKYTGTVEWNNLPADLRNKLLQKFNLMNTTAQVF